MHSRYISIDYGKVYKVKQATSEMSNFFRLVPLLQDGHDNVAIAFQVFPARTVGGRSLAAVAPGRLRRVAMQRDVEQRHLRRVDRQNNFSDDRKLDGIEAGVAIAFPGDLAI